MGCASRRADRRGRDASDPTPPAQLPACGFSAPGSSRRRAAAIPLLGGGYPLRAAGLGTPARHVRPTLPVRAPAHVTPFPLWTPLPPSASSEVIRLPMHHRLPCVIGAAYLVPGVHGVSQVLSVSLCLPGPEDPDRPSGISPCRCLAWASGACKPSPSAFWPSRGCTRLHGVRPFRPPEFPVDTSPVLFARSPDSTTGATRGMGGCLDLTRWGLPPHKKRQASLGARTPAFSCCRKRRVARACYHTPAPEEPCMRVAPHTAQAPAACSPCRWWCA